MSEWHLHTHPIEVVWLVCSVAAFVMTNLTLYNAVRDLAFLDARAINKEPRLIAICNLRREALYMSMAGVSVLSALTAIWLEPPPPDYLTIAQIVFGMLGWIAVSVLMGLSSLLDRRLHQQLAHWGPALKPGDVGFMERRRPEPPAETP